MDLLNDLLQKFGDLSEKTKAEIDARPANTSQEIAQKKQDLETWEDANLIFSQQILPNKNLLGSSGLDDLNKPPPPASNNSLPHMFGL